MPDAQVKNWVYDSRSSQGRPDRVRSKFSSEEALNQMHRVDGIFPIYEKFYNDTKSENTSSVIEILSERIHNIETELTKLEEDYDKYEIGSSEASITRLQACLMTFVLFNLISFKF